MDSAVAQMAFEPLRNCRIFRALSDQAIRQVAREAGYCRFSKGSVLMRQGDPSEAMYIIARGRVRVERMGDEADQSAAALAELSVGEVVGEMGVLDGLPRSATVVAITDVTAMEIEAARLVDLMVHYPEVNETLRHIVSQRLRATDALLARMFADLLRRAAIFQPVSPAGLSHLAEAGKRRHFFAGDTLMRQGEESDCLHLIARGRVRVERSHRDLTAPVRLAELGPGEVVGEMGIFDSAPRSATVIAAEDVETMELDALALSAAMVQFPEIATALLHTVTKRIRSTDKLLDELIARRHGADLGSPSRN